MTNKQKTLLILLTTVLTAGLLAPSFAQGPREQSDDWQWVLTPYFWLAGMDGDVTVKGNKSSVDEDFSDLVEKLDFAAMGRVEAWKNNFGITSDMVYMSLEDDFKTPGPDIDVTLEQFIWDLGASVMLSESPLGSSGVSKITFEAMGGGRYVYIEPAVDFRPGPKFDKSLEYFEPFFGGRIRVRINEKWLVAVRGDIGGFDIGDSSDLTWNLVVAADLALSERTSLVFGYKIMDINVDKGSGPTKNELDMQISGPAIGVAIHL